MWINPGTWQKVLLWNKKQFRKSDLLSGPLFFVAQFPKTVYNGVIVLSIAIC